MLRALLLSCLLALPAAADCVTKADLVKGIAFTRQDGHAGRVQTQGGALVVDYVTDHKGWYDRRVTRFGVFETQFDLWLSDAVLVGGEAPVMVWRFSPAPIAPQPDKGWTASVHQVVSHIGYGSQMVKLVNRDKSDLSAKFQFLTVIEAKLSGCSYRILPVEARFTGPGGSQTRRWIYFPDLGFGLETARDGVQNGLTALVAE